MLVAWGFTEQGERVLLSVMLGMRESHEDWLALGRDLIARGLGAPLLIVADGAPHEMKQLAASRRIRCATSLTVDRLQQMPGVASVRRDGATTELLTNDAERVTRDLLIADASLSGLEVTGAGLEEAFLALTSARGQESAMVTGGVR